MAYTFSVSGKDSTPKGYLDFARPRVMIDGDKIYNNVMLDKGNTSPDALLMLSQLSEVIKDTTTDKLPKFWSSLERKLNHNKPLSCSSSTDIGKFSTALSIFYSALDTIDKQSTTSTADMQSFRSVYLDLRSYVENRILNHQTGMDKRVLQRVINTIDGRFDLIGKRLNKLVEAEKINGPALSLLSE